MVRRQTRTPWLPAWASILRRFLRRRALLHCSARECFLLTPLARYAMCVVELHDPHMVSAAEGLTRDVDGRSSAASQHGVSHDIDIILFWVLQLAAMLATGNFDVDALLGANGLGAMGSANNLQVCMGAGTVQHRQSACSANRAMSAAACVTGCGAVVGPSLVQCVRRVHTMQALQGLPGMLGGDGMGFNGGLPPMQQGGYPQAPPPRLGRSSMDTAGNGSPTHSGLAGM
jgi:hypothetical protein